MKTLKLTLLSAALATAMLTGVANAETTATLNVSANVQNSCTAVTADALNFGTLDPASSTGTTQNSAIHVTCGVGTTFDTQIGTSPNGASSGDPKAGQRAMLAKVSNGEYATLSYELYTDAAYSSIWGNGSGYGSEVPRSTVDQNGTTVDLTVYGKVFPAQHVPDGVYNDSLLVSIITVPSA